MPRYTYRCQNCEIVFQVVHSIKEKLKDCEECQTEDNLQRIPSIPLILNKNESEDGRKPGSLVKEFIEDAKGELKKDKVELSRQVYKDD